jgi:hypothetical protein
MADKNKVNMCEMRLDGFICTVIVYQHPGCKHANLYEMKPPECAWLRDGRCTSYNARKEAAETTVRIGQDYLTGLANERDE